MNREQSFRLNGVSKFIEAVGTLDQMMNVFDKNNPIMEVVIRPYKKTRTSQQRKSLEVYCKQMADALNGAGYDKRQIFNKFKTGVFIPWTQESFKQDVFKLVTKAMFDLTSTTKLTTMQIQEIYLVVDERISEMTNGNISFPWPSELSQAEEQRFKTG